MTGSDADDAGQRGFLKTASEFEPAFGMGSQDGRFQKRRSDEAAQGGA